MQETLNARVTITGSHDNIERLYRKLQIYEIGEGYPQTGLLKKGTLSYEPTRITGQCAGLASDAQWKKLSDEFDVDMLITRYDPEMETEKKAERG